MLAAKKSHQKDDDVPIEVRIHYIPYDEFCC